jgi:phenylacetate-CoA ligase
MTLELPESRESIANIQRARKRVAVEQARRAPFFAGKLDNINLDRLDDWDEWSKIPLLEKDDLRKLTPAEFRTDFCVGDPNQIAELWRSGGSTGAPLFYPRTFEDMKYGRLSFARNFDCAGFDTVGAAHVSFPLGVHPVGQVFARVAQERGLGVNWAGSGASTPSVAQVQLLEYLKPRYWLGMSSYGIHLANLATEQGIDLANGSVERILCSAEPLSTAKREKIERMWGAQVFDGFGMTEAGMMGCESSARDGFHIWTDLFYIEVLDPQSLQPMAEGEVGTLVVTPLWTNNATPFLRWSSGDLVSWHSQGAADGPFSVFPIVRHAHRTSGFFKVRGMNIGHPEFEDFMFSDADVNDFKCDVISEDSRDELCVHIEARETVEEGSLAQSLSNRIKNTFEIMPRVIVLERGTLAAEFESAVKAPRFVDRRSED